jgi:hypothetical protein
MAGNPERSAQPSFETHGSATLLRMRAEFVAAIISFAAAQAASMKW